MLHSMRRPLVALLSSVALSVLALALWVAVLNASPPPGPSANPFATLFVPGPTYCSNWDFLNSTGQPANDLHIRLKGVSAVTAVYTGTFNPFGLPTSSGYDGGANVYTMTFSGATVNDSDMVHLGFCANAALVLLDPSSPSPFEWTLDGTKVLTNPNPLFTGVEWTWPTKSHLHLRVVNHLPVTTTLMSMQLFNAGVGLSLDDLNSAAVDTLPMVLDMLPLVGGFPTPQTLPPNSETAFDAFFNDPNGVPPDHAQIFAPPYLYVLEAVLVSEADPTDSAHLFAQSMAPFLSTHLPIIQR